MICAKSYSGKTYLLNELVTGCLSKLYDNKNIFVFSPTFMIDDSTNDMRNLIPIGNIKKNVDVKFINELCKSNEQRKLKGLKMIPYLLIFDDCLQAEELKSYNSVLPKFSTLSRHSMICCIWVTQVYTLLPSSIRENCDVVILLFVKRISK
jgi:hypothetical protein